VAGSTEFHDVAARHDDACRTSLEEPAGSVEARPIPPLAERFEGIAYRVLLVVAFVGLANSNPTLREMVDARA
jgi:hypothetical protein